MVKRRFIPPPTQAKGDAAVKRFVPRPNIQVPTLPKQPEKPLQSNSSEINAAGKQIYQAGVKPLENATPQQPAAPKPLQSRLDEVNAARNQIHQGGGKPLEDVTPKQPATQVVPDKGLQDQVAGYQRTGKEPLQNATQPTRSDAPPPPQQDSAAGHARVMALSKNPTRQPPPAPTPERNAEIGAAAQQQNITAEKSGRDYPSQNGQDQAKEKEKTQDKNRDKDHER